MSDSPLRYPAGRVWAVVSALALLASCASPESGGTRRDPGAPVLGGRDGADGSCAPLPSAEVLRRLLQEAPSRAQAGGLMEGRLQWASVVDRSGRICATAVATDDATSAWPGSQAIAKAKAFTANAFSTDQAPLSTARLYSLSQPGQSLWGIANGNPFSAECLVAPGDATQTDGRLCGGTIAFGGGVPLYREGRRVGGLGVSGDTACADHEIAKTMRDIAGLNPPGGRGADDIVYASDDGTSVFAHPLCVNTYRDGRKIGDEERVAALSGGDR